MIDTLHILSSDAASGPAGSSWELGLTAFNTFVTVALAVVFALWSRRDTTGDRLSDTQQQLVLSKIDALAAKVEASIARHEADIAELMDRVTAGAERLAVVETREKESRDALRRVEAQMQDFSRRLDTVAHKINGAGGQGG